MSDELLAYCMKCRTKRPIAGARAIFTAKGTPATQGHCEVCGTTLTRFGATAEHANLPRPVVEKQAAAPTKRATARAGRKPPAKKTARRTTTAAPRGERSSARGKKLVVVESPTKARTIGRFLGHDYTVRASVGHVRDLLKSKLSVDVDHNFEPTYRVPNEKKEVVRQLTKDVAEASEIYMATDPDREGEAIAWHLLEATGAPAERIKRVVFHEITQPAVADAFAHPRAIDMELVNAQQARRILDRLVGYGISPLLWERVRSRTSAGRVQSVALRLVVEREREIDAFVPEEYWTIEAELAKRPANGHGKAGKAATFIAKLIKIDGKDASLKTRADTQRIVAVLQKAAYSVADVRRGERRRNPSPPFTTSTLQQEASRRLGFSARKTMTVAQELYEGVNIGDEGSTGLITYMRTDSTQVSEVAQKEARAYIAQQFGKEYLPDKPPTYKARSKNAQEAHEAIRPTAIHRTPDAIGQHLTRDQQRLYTLIWQRLVASQMTAAIYDTIAVDVNAAPARPTANGHKGEGAAAQVYLFRATGATVRFPGYLAVYQDSREDDETEEKQANIPPLTVGELLDLLRLLPEQHFTQPPPRYTEATLVKALEEQGIGRPSTYAPIISTIQARGYVEVKERRLRPTELGFTINDLVVKHFPEQVDIGFTAQMEEKLDEIARGEYDWVQAMHEFYRPFATAIKTAEKTMEHARPAEEPTGEMCEKCGSPLIIKHGRFGKFIACSNYPTCKNTKPIVVKTGARCPECGGEIVERRSRKGRVFYGCTNYPTCKFTSWSKPLPVPCPHCGGLLVVQGKDRARCLKCAREFTQDSLAPEAETIREASTIHA